ncbi:hypothetical protein [Streptomyces sp. GC420]|uniref:hypothetical protein n=1 Tax=Streptomyces sp. GC420 TaxID=2697568 RepID=UPI0014151614|nr:hypothetical protein [Streptomyces sp. GC420]NBM15276.1 hypothetical protein [Streptomyces sp. GC420]
MKRSLEFVGMVLLVEGGGGLLAGLSGLTLPVWIVLPRIGFLDGYQVFSGAVLAVLGLAVLVASDRVAR